MSPNITLGTTQGTWGLVFSCPGASRLQAPICEAGLPLCKPSSATEPLSRSVHMLSQGFPEVLKIPSSAERPGQAGCQEGL